MSDRGRYYSAEFRDKDDFGVAFTKQPGEVVYDAVTKHGPWAMMTETSWKTHGRGVLGTGRGQKYRRDEQDRFMKVEG